VKNPAFAGFFLHKIKELWSYVNRVIKKGWRMKYSIFLISVIFVSFVQADVYKYTNKQGKTAYSDTPVVGAEKVVVPPVMTYEAASIPTKETVVIGGKEESEEGAIPYSYINVTSPAEQGTVRSNQGLVNVTYQLQPALKKGDRVELFLDGVVQESFNIQGLVRGEHIVMVQVVNNAGEQQISSPEVTFYLQHNSKQ